MTLILVSSRLLLCGRSHAPRSNLPPYLALWKALRIISKNRQWTHKVSNTTWQILWLAYMICTFKWIMVLVLFAWRYIIWFFKMKNGSRFIWIIAYFIKMARKIIICYKNLFIFLDNNSPQIDVYII